MSSKYATTKWPMKRLSTCCINVIKVLGALVKPKRHYGHSYNPSLVLKVVLHSSLAKSKSGDTYSSDQFFKTPLTSNMSNMSSSCSIGNRYFTVVLFMALLSMHFRKSHHLVQFRFYQLVLWGQSVKLFGIFSHRPIALSAVMVLLKQDLVIIRQKKYSTHQSFHSLPRPN